MTVRNSTRKIKSLEHAVQHLKLEIEDIAEEMSEYVKDFTEQLARETQYPDKENVSDLKQKKELVELTEKIDLPVDLKKLWKKIASVTHPDKTGNNQKLTVMYRKALEAVDAASVQDLVQIAVELGIEIPDYAANITIQNLLVLKQNLEEKLMSLENSVLIRWGREKSQEEKRSIMNFYIDEKDYSRK